MLLIGFIASILSFLVFSAFILPIEVFDLLDDSFGNGGGGEEGKVFFPNVDHPVGVLQFFDGNGCCFILKKALFNISLVGLFWL